MRIAFHKHSDREHTLEVEREGHRESVRCETRSYLEHDLLHYALEAEADVRYGVWGRLHGGATLALLNDRMRPPALQDAQLAMIETLVGGMSSVLKGAPPERFVHSLQTNADAFEWSIPAWLTPALVEAVIARMHALRGRWHATPNGKALVLFWPPEG